MGIFCDVLYSEVLKRLDNIAKGSLEKNFQDKMKELGFDEFSINICTDFAMTDYREGILNAMKSLHGTELREYLIRVFINSKSNTKLSESTRPSIEDLRFEGKKFVYKVWINHTIYEVHTVFANLGQIVDANSRGYPALANMPINTFNSKKDIKKSEEQLESQVSFLSKVEQILGDHCVYAKQTESGIKNQIMVFKKDNSTLGKYLTDMKQDDYDDKLESRKISIYRDLFTLAETLDKNEITYCGFFPEKIAASYKIDEGYVYTSIDIEAESLRILDPALLVKNSEICREVSNLYAPPEAILDKMDLSDIENIEHTIKKWESGDEIRFMNIMIEFLVKFKQCIADTHDKNELKGSDIGGDVCQRKLGLDINDKLNANITASLQDATAMKKTLEKDTNWMLYREDRKGIKKHLESLYLGLAKAYKFNEYYKETLIQTSNSRSMNVYSLGVLLFVIELSFFDKKHEPSLTSEGLIPTFGMFESIREVFVSQIESGHDQEEVLKEYRNNLFDLITVFEKDEPPYKILDYAIRHVFVEKERRTTVERFKETIFSIINTTTKLVI